MTTLKSIRDIVILWLEDESINDDIDMVINSMIRLTTTDEFEGLKRTADVTPDSDGVIVCPAAYRMALGIFPQCSYGSMPGFEFFPRTSRVRADEPRTNRYLYHTHESTRSADTTGMVLSGTQGDTTLTQVTTAITADMEGQELKILGDNTRYLITSATADTSLEVFPSLRADSSTSLSAEVNPAGMRRYTLTYPNGNVYIDTVTVDYQMDHPPLVLDDDELLIPLERTIALLTVQQFLQQSKYDVDAQRLEDAVFLARSAEYGTEPTNRQDAAPKDTTFAFRSKRRRGYNRR